MAPVSTTEVEALTRYFASCGLSESRSTELCKNAKLASAAQALFEVNHLEAGSALNDKQVVLLLQLSKDAGKLGQEERNHAVRAIVEERFKTPEQVTGQSV